MFMLSNLLFKYITIHHAAILKNTLYCNGKFKEMVLSRLLQLFVLILFPRCVLLHCISSPSFPRQQVRCK